MKQVTLSIAQHRNNTILRIDFSYDRRLIELAKSVGAQWSQSKQCWYLPYTDGIVSQVFNAFKGKAWVDYSQLKGRDVKPTNPSTLPQMALDPEIKKAINSFTDWMRNRRYSEKTINTYMNGLYLFFGFVANKAPEAIVNEDLERFHKEYIIAGGYSQSFQSQVINAVKLFFTNRHNRKLDPALIERPKKEKKLPNVLSKEEVKKILEAPANLKHRAMLSLIYACGLRRSELLNLRLKDVDSKRKLLIIRGAKGKKDRIVPLSDKVLTMLREYYKFNRPKTYLFEGYQAGEQYSEGSLQKVLKNALQKSGIQKPVTLHWLRHSYATHLLENGTDLRYIQEILGHKSSQTTELYTHVTDNSIKQIKTPFDDL